jgi:hypothetical protein
MQLRLNITSVVSLTCRGSLEVKSQCLSRSGSSASWNVCNLFPARDFEQWYGVVACQRVGHTCTQCYSKLRSLSLLLIGLAANQYFCPEVQGAYQCQLNGCIYIWCRRLSSYTTISTYLPNEQG